jgi:ribosomal protein S18 acetylase RimI-like enzyme
MTFSTSTIEDLDTIFQLYDIAIAHQKAVSNMHWLPFDRELVAQEIAEGRQWKIELDGQVACVFVVAYQDPAIWGEKDRDPSIYLHRIVTHSDFRGRNFVGAILEWSKEHGKALGKAYVRLDTWAENLKLKEIYERNGFQFLGVVTPSDLSALPSHYSGIRLSIFQAEVHR